MYRFAKKTANKVVYRAQEVERKRLGDMLEEAEKKGNVFVVPKRMLARNKDVVGDGCIKDRSGRIVVGQEDIKEVCRQYFAKLLNEEFSWDRNSIVAQKIVNGQADQISVDEVRAAISKMKAGKAVGPSGIGAEMLQVAG